MKKIFLSLMVLAVLVTACKKSDSTPDTTSQLNFTWTHVKDVDWFIPKDSTNPSSKDTTVYYSNSKTTFNGSTIVVYDSSKTGGSSYTLSYTLSGSTISVLGTPSTISFPTSDSLVTYSAYADTMNLVPGTKKSWGFYKK
jgi:hypothetical protein